MVPDVLPSTPLQKQHNELITPHKIALLVIIKEYCTAKIDYKAVKCSKGFDDVWLQTPKHCREISIALLKLIQNPDIDLKQLNNIIHPILHPKTYQLIVNRLYVLRIDGITEIMDCIQKLESLLVDATPNVPIVQKSSVIGLFIRRMLLAFDKLTFTQVTKLCKKFCAYYDALFGCPDEIANAASNKIIEDSDLEESTEELHIQASQKQAEFFIAQQAALLQINEKEALPPQELQQRIRDLLKGNPALTEAHYLSFLNALRVKEYCGAIENLYHHFDRNPNISFDCKSATQSDDANRSFRYAALNLAILHARFGHRQEAMAALQEAIMASQEVNDNICLQHALTWRYRLSDENKEILIERSVSKSGELNLWYLSSLGIQALTQQKCITSAMPSCIFELLMKSDILNCQHSMTDNMVTGYAQRAALWTHYGNSSMSNLMSELLLYLNTSDPLHNGVYHMSEGFCIALRNIAMTFALESNINHAVIILGLAKQLFPSHSEHSHVWKFCELIIKFQKALYSCSWNKAEKLVDGIAIFDAKEAEYRKAELFISRGNLSNAFEIIKKLSIECTTKDLLPHFHVRVFLAKASLLCQTVNYNLAIPSLMTCLEICKIHHLLYLEALSIMYLSNIQLLLDLPNKALQLLDRVFITFLSHGSYYDRGCCYLLYAKCIAASVKDETNIEKKTEALLTAASMSETAIEYFLKLNAYHKAKYALCWLAHLYNILRMYPERNLSAFQFKSIDQQFPCSNWNGLFIP